MSTVEELGKEKFKSMLKVMFTKTDNEVIDENFDTWYKKYKKEPWMHVTKTLRQQLEPNIWQEREQLKVTGICLGSVDRPLFEDGVIVGVKENEVSHCVMTDDEIVQISDRGTPDIKWGNEYTFNCMSGVSEKGNRWYSVDNDEAPEKLRTFKDDEIMKKLNSMAKEIPDLKHGEVSVVKVKMTHKIFSMQGDSTVDICEGNIQLRMICKGFQYANSVNMYISFILNPQKFGEQHFKGLFGDHFYTDLKNASGEEEKQSIIREWIVPDGDLDVLVVGRAGVGEDNYGINHKMVPVYMMMLDLSSFEFDEYIQSRIKEKDTPEGFTFSDEEVDIYLKKVEEANGTISYEDLKDELRLKAPLWGIHYIEEITNYLLDKNYISEAILGTITLVATEVKDSPQKPSEDKDLMEITDNTLDAYLHYNPDITVSELAGHGYDVSEEQLKDAKNPTVTYDKIDLDGMKKDELVIICEGYGINKTGKKADMIDRILKYQESEQ